VHRDYNGDGLMDLAITTGGWLYNEKYYNDVAVMLGVGEGITKPSQVFGDLDQGPVSIDAADLDGDGDLDLATANLKGTIAVFVNDGQGVFGDPLYFSSGDGATCLRLGDIDGDGRVDALTMDKVSKTLSILKNTTPMPGLPPIFALAQQIPIGGVPTSIIAESPRATMSLGDMDGDGDLDAVLPGQGWIRVAINDGAGTFELWPTKITNPGAVAYCVELADVDLDGDLDIASIGQYWEKLFLHKNASANGQLAFEPVETHSLANTKGPGDDDLVSLTVGDFDGDGYPDLAIGNRELWGVLLLMNHGASADAGSTFKPMEFRATGNNFPMLAHAADMNADGLDDLFVGITHPEYSALHLSLPGMPVVAGEESIDHVNGQTNGMYFHREARWVDLNKDGRLDAISLDAGDEGLYVSYADEQGRLRDYDLHPLGSMAGSPQANFAVPVDLNSDGWMDVAVSVNVGLQWPSLSGSVHVFMNDGVGRLISPPAVYEVGGRIPLNLAAADVDQDGHTDLVAFCNDPYQEPPETPTRVALVVLRNDGAGALTTLTPSEIDTGIFGYYEGLAVADFDGDGDSDAACFSSKKPPNNGVPANLHITLNHGGQFTEVKSQQIPIYPRHSEAADIDGDGDMDLVVTYSNLNTLPPGGVYMQIFENDGLANLTLRDSFESDLDYPSSLRIVPRPERGEVFIYTESCGVWLHAIDMASGALKSLTFYHAIKQTNGFDVRRDGGPLDLVFAANDRYGSFVTVRDMSCEAPVCPADCDASGTLNIDDFICFQTYFALGDGKADCDGSQNLDIDDFICFQTAFVLGC
jgi:hypothetical protein